MIDCIFTIDYEIYGNGEGSLKELVFEPAARLAALFSDAGAHFVNFVEAAELRQIQRYASDSALEKVEQQIRDLHEQGHEIALHLHPQWANARFEHGRWVLDYREYNLCHLGRERIDQIVRDGIDYIRSVLGESDFNPVSFRAGNWLFQPTGTAASVLAAHGVRIDSSVFKGGRQHEYRLDYRPAGGNGFYWRFSADAATAAPTGVLLEIPIYTRMVAFWKMATGKRLGLQHKAATTRSGFRRKYYRLLDLARLRHPLKFDFCRMTFAELRGMMDRVLREDQQQPESYKPLVAIGHTKDLNDFDTVRDLLRYLKEKRVTISTLEKAYSRCCNG